MSTQEPSVKLRPNITWAPGAQDRARILLFTEEGWMGRSESSRCPPKDFEPVFSLHPAAKGLGDRTKLTGKWENSGLSAGAGVRT